MNHGRCKNCWWYKKKHGHSMFTMDMSSMKIEGCSEIGICYMQSINVGIEGCEELIEVRGDSYCFDYINRKKEKGSLDDWIDSIREKNGRK